MQYAKRVRVALSFAFIIAGAGCLMGCNNGGSTNTTDTTPPTAPSNAVANVVSNSQINLTWTASTDNVGVTQYQIQRCTGAACSPTTQVGTSTTNSFQDTGLAGSTSYSYRVSASDAANNVSGFSNTASATTGASIVAVNITPVRGGLTITQKLSLTSTVTGDSSNAGVSWTFTSTGSTTGGSFSANNSASGTPVTFTAPSGAGIVTVTATSVADITKSASATIGVTDLAGIYTYHNDNSRDGVNTQEYALTTANVASSFTKLFTCSVDGAVYAQPLWVANVTISSVKHNVIVVATQHDSLYAFDADASPCATLWHANLIDAGHSGTSGENPVISNNTATSQVGGGAGDIAPEVGVTGTPVIDPSTNTIYVVSKSVNAAKTFFQRLHAIDLLTGAEKFSGPANIDTTITVPGTGDGSSGGVLPFHPQNEHQRAALALAGGIVYVAWASHEDHDPYHGWVMGFSATNLSLQYKFNDSPNGNRGGIWMAGGAPAIDSSNNLFLITGNGDFDGTNDFGDSILRLSSTLVKQDFFTPSIQDQLNSSDLDLGSGGAVVLVDNPSLPTGFQHLLIGGGKGGGFTGQLYLLDRTNLGQFNGTDIGAKQIFAVGSGIFATPAFWQNTLYIAGTGTNLFAYSLNTSGVNAGKFNTVPVSQSSGTYGFPGATPSVSAKGTTNGIVWALNNNSYCTPQSSGCGPAVLHAYDATNLNTELWSSSQGSGNTAGFAVKFTVPTVANGKVYIGTRGNNAGGADNSTSTPGELDVYGLKPN